MAPRRQREKLVQIRVSDAELAEIGEKADRVGLAIASYARQILLTHLPVRSVRRPPIDRTVVSQLLASLGPIASDVRDIARSSKMTDEEADRLALALTSLSDIRDVLMRSLGRNP